MKIFPKIIKTFFILIFLLQLASLAFLLFSPVSTQAADPTFTPQVGLPGSREFGPGATFTFNTKDTKPIGLYIQAIYKYAIGIVGILATVVLMVAGIIWITAGGASERISEAKAWIGASLTGLVIALSSYMILATINPALVNFKVSVIQSVDAIGCCVEYSPTFQCSYKIEKDCPGSYYKISCESVDTCRNVATPNANVSSIGCQVPSDTCFTPDGRKGYCGTIKSETCNPCKVAGSECGGVGRDYECCSDNCNFGLTSNPYGFSCAETKTGGAGGSFGVGGAGGSF